MKGNAILADNRGAIDMDDAEDDDAVEALQEQLSAAREKLDRAYAIRDALAADVAEAEQEGGVMPADLLVSLSQAERAMLAAEAEVADAEHALLSALNRQTHAAR